MSEGRKITLVLSPVESESWKITGGHTIYSIPWVAGMEGETDQMGN